jgi:hypothetical protein
MLRTGQQQLKDELGVMYKRLTDPYEREIDRLRAEQDEYIASIAQDAGIEYNPYDDNSY